MGAISGALSWPTAVLFSLNRENPSLTILREAWPRPVSNDALGALDMPLLNTAEVEKAVAGIKAAAKAAINVLQTQVKHGLLPRTYQGALVRQALREQMQMGETSPG
ncbi:hypothetical protein ACFY0A_39655 [Streptomyces sp. NPDC001698]|uniref:hypothetical protein n=1 Tax=Streptomyces sp. NPDC001698 TaxID=3364601 RepID=UPI0036AED44A